MYQDFIESLRAARVPVSLREYLTFVESLASGIVDFDVEAFYFLARSALVKDERNFDRFDRAFSHFFKGVAGASLEDLIAATGKARIPDDWLRKLAGRHFTPEEMKAIESLGGFEALMDALEARLEEQTAEHRGGNRWIGTAGTSPFGAHGYNPEGIRIGQGESRHQRAVNVWDRREFRNLDGGVELGTRNIKVALRRIRRWARDGADDELDLPETIRSTARNGFLDVRVRPERRNAVKVLLFLDVGGSMDVHVRKAEALFSAARSEFRHLEHFYFHNCLYEGVWKDNRRRWSEQIPTWDVIRTFNADYKCVFVGDASMSPYEIVNRGGASEYFNAEPGQLWLERAREQWPDSVWINPLREDFWPHTRSISMIRSLFDGQMFPLTLEGVESATRVLAR